MGKVIINGKMYDSLTGLQIKEESRTDIKMESSIADPVVDISPVQPSSIKSSTPRTRRVSKQERLAAAVAQEFASEQKAKREISPKPTRVEQETGASVAVSAEDSPSWIANYVEGHDPIEIESIHTTPSHNKQHAHNPAGHHGRHQLQRSQTLNRRFVKKPSVTPHVVIARSATTVIDKHPDVHRFAPITIKAAEPIAAPKVASREKSTVHKTSPDTPFVPAVSHATAAKLVASESQPVALAGSNLKDFLIKSQLDQPVDRKARRKAEKSAAKLGTKRRFTRTSLVTAALAIAVLGGYMAYTNMPSLSIRVAASQAGIDSQSPYTPNGYSLDGPVAYSPGQITIKYKSNSGSPGYSITEQNTALDGKQAFDSLSQSNSDYTTDDLDGTTIYYHNDNATWVKDGVLYTLSGNSLLSNDQISRIVKSV